MEVQGDWAYTGESISRENHIQPKRMYAKAGEEQMVCPPRRPLHRHRESKSYENLRQAYPYLCYNHSDYC